MPLKIESGSYEVNRRKRPDSAPIKKLSKFSVWKHWRRSVHEERSTSEDRQQQQQHQRTGILIGSNVSSSGTTESPTAADSGGGGGGRREVAGLLARADSPGASLPRTSRRSRPHSLAVQPLNYQRLDPEQQLRNEQPQPPPPRLNVITVSSSSSSSKRTTAVASSVGKKHPSMTSQESIGSCSLDVERSASDRSDLNAGSLSEKTLHSLALSTCNGDSSVEASTRTSQQQHCTDPLSNGTTTQQQRNESNNISSCSGAVIIVTGADPSEPDEQYGEQLTRQKKPSYLGLACSINGYSGITRYDSKLREGFRSRDSSPGARLIARDTSPAGFRSSDPQSLTAQPNPPKSQSISPLAMDRQRNGLANGVRDKYLDSRTASPYSSDGYSEVDRGIVGSARDEPILSPVRASSPNRKAESPVAARIASYNQQNNKSFGSASSPKSLNVSHTSSHNDSSILNGSSSFSEQQDASICILNASLGSEKSFIQQRVERLYGPGALAQGFYKRGSAPPPRASAKQPSSAVSSDDAAAALHARLFNKSINNNNTASVVAAAAAEVIDEEAVARDDEESLKSLPVLRHLRPEFRAQLPVVSPRRPTDGTEQVIKPLKRISVSSQKTDTKESKERSAKPENETISNGSKMAPSVATDADQQPAAPEVVLPALEPGVASLASAPNQAAQAGPRDDKEKDGHYYLNLLNTEKNRLQSMALHAEEELANGTKLGIPEEAAGKLRSAIGKTGLLTNQRMKQFEGLCQKNINKVPNEEFPTTNEDLAGFWDMVMLQVVQIDGMYAVIDTLRQAGWQETPDKPTPLEQRSAPSTPQNGTAARRRQTPASRTKSSADAEASRRAREAREQSRRQMLEERRRAMRANAANNKSSDNAIEIFAPET